MSRDNTGDGLFDSAEEPHDSESEEDTGKKWSDEENRVQEHNLFPNGEKEGRPPRVGIIYRAMLEVQSNIRNVGRRAKGREISPTREERGVTGQASSP